MHNAAPFSVIKSVYVTEKSQKLAAASKNSKVTFLVDVKATKHQIAAAVEQIYKEQSVRVAKVNTVRMLPRLKRVRGRLGHISGYKKAVVTLQPGSSIQVS